jgi:hypothetical protein
MERKGYQIGADMTFLFYLVNIEMPRQGPLAYLALQGQE